MGTALAIAGRLARSRVLLAYCLLGILSGLFMGTAGLGRALANYALLALYVLVIFLWTRHEPTVTEAGAGGVVAPGPISGEENREAVAPARGSRRDLALVLLLPALNLAYIFWISSGTSPLGSAWQATRSGLTGAGWDPRLAGTAGNAVANTAGMLLPALVLAFAFGLRPGQVGLVPRRLDLAAFLIVLGIAFGGASKLLVGKAPPLFDSPEGVPLAVAIYGAHVFVNGLPEEFVFRGVVLSRLLARLRNPHHALVLGSILFVGLHVPSLLSQAPPGMPWWVVVFGPLVTPGPQPTGLVWGYLFYRTRSIWPGVLWHTSFTTLGILFA